MSDSFKEVHQLYSTDVSLSVFLSLFDCGRYKWQAKQALSGDYIAKITVKDFNKLMNDLQCYQFVIFGVLTNHKVETGIATRVLDSHGHTNLRMEN